MIIITKQIMPTRYTALDTLAHVGNTTVETTNSNIKTTPSTDIEVE